MTEGPPSQDVRPGAGDPVRHAPGDGAPADLPTGAAAGGPTTGEEELQPVSPTSRERWRTFGAPALAIVTVVALCLGVLLGWLVLAPDHPGDDSAEAGFARDMSEHHAQAVQMSQLVMQRSEDEDVRRLAVDIDNNQNFERGQMAAWLAEWGLQRARAGERMEWMGHEEHAEDLPPGVPMPGMATPTEIEELTEATGEEAEVLYLQLMTTHHIAGVEMAEAVLDLGQDPEVLATAQRMVDAQTGEVRLMNDMLEERGSQTREDVSEWLSDQGSAAEDASRAPGHPTH
jgi:uncharacterized protein (DUF305 family)